jgi:hypothetical protein
VGKGFGWLKITEVLEGLPIANAWGKGRAGLIKIIKLIKKVLEKGRGAGVTWISMRRELAPVTRQSTPCHGGESSCTPSLVGGRGVVESLLRAYTRINKKFFQHYELDCPRCGNKIQVSLLDSWGSGHFLPSRYFSDYSEASDSFVCFVCSRCRFQISACSQYRG